MRKMRIQTSSWIRCVAVVLLLCLCALQLCVGTAFAAPGEGASPGAPAGGASPTTPGREGAAPQSTEGYEILQAHGPYTVAYSENYSPFSYMDESGTVSGMAIDVMDYIAQLADIEITYISVGDAERYGTDVDINLAILAEDQLESVSIKSVAYSSLQMMAVSNTAVLEPRDATVGHLPYYYLDNEIIENALPGCITYSYFTYAEMAQDFLLGTLDYMLVTSLVANQMLETTYQVDTNVVPTNVNLQFFISYSQSLSDEEVNSFNALIRSLDSEYIYSLMLSSVISAADVEITFEKILESYAIPILLALWMVVGIIIFIILKGDYSKRSALERSLNVDEITGLLTERKFIKDVVDRLRTASPGEYYIITMDIDHFKLINESYGYEVGTKSIVLFGEMLKNIFPKGTLIARYFADNFVILYGARDEGFHTEHAMEYEEIISKSMAGLLGENYRLTTSTGIYKVENFSLPLSYMIDCANVARLRCKIDYGISKMEFTKHLEKRMQQKNDIVRFMETAIEGKEFQIYYQPKISLKTGGLMGAEALIRWIRPDGQRRYPDEFIPLFESNGFILRVDFFVLETVCEFLHRNPQISKVSVNFSGLSMLSDGLVERVKAITDRYDIAPSRLEIEITESAVVRNFERIVRQTTKLKELGFAISMDDFGTGISSLNRLKDLDIDVLKIDKGFLGEKILTERGSSIIKHIISMARDLGIATIAEGVEYPEHEVLLKSMGCDMAQGYHYARPLPEEDYLEFVRNYAS